MYFPAKIWFLWMVLTTSPVAPVGKLQALRTFPLGSEWNTIKSVNWVFHIWYIFMPLTLEWCLKYLAEISYSYRINCRKLQLFRWLLSGRQTLKVISHGTPLIVYFVFIWMDLLNGNDVHESIITFDEGSWNNQWSKGLDPDYRS